MQHIHTIPVLRSFDEARTKAFYCDFLGFAVDWEHRFEPGLPLFMQVSRDGMLLWLSEHHGDATPGSRVALSVTGLSEFHAEIGAREYANARPGIGEFIAGGTELVVTDPSGNTLWFFEETNAKSNKR